MEVKNFSLPLGIDKSKLSFPMFDGRFFQNPFDTWVQPNFWTLVKWKTASKAPPSNFPKMPTEAEAAKHLKVCEPTFESPKENCMAVTWLGHATCLVEADGVSWLTDPMFSNHCAPTFVKNMAKSSVFSKLTTHIRRYLRPPCAVCHLPNNLRFVLISHNHFDHLDSESCVAIANKYGDRVAWCVPLGLRHTMEMILPAYARSCIHEFNWWEGKVFTFRKTEKEPPISFRIAATPCQHWSTRNGFFDRNKSLWSSWVVISPSNKRFYFGGDTGYCRAFKEVGKVFGPFDLAAIPIGGFEPKDIMSPQHVDPEEAVKLHCDIKSKLSIGIHWGTFPMSDEGFLEPELDLMSIASPDEHFTTGDIKSCENNTISLSEMVRRSKLKISFVTVNCGQTYQIDNLSAI